MTEQSVLETLRRVPDRIILATMGRELEFSSNSSCLCGWVLREKLAEIRNCPASKVSWMSYGGTPEELANHLGGEDKQWAEIFYGVCNPRELRTIERAFVRRVDEAVFGRPAKETTR